MFCPKCSQESPPDLRFCPRCGFQLTVVAELLATNGSLVKSDLAPKSPILQRSNIRSGAQILFFSAVSIIPAVFLSILFDSPFPFLIPLIATLIGVFMILYVVLFGKDAPAEGEQRAEKVASLPGDRIGRDLPPTVPEIDFPARKTAEFAEPPSVTEPTTKLLDEH